MREFNVGDKVRILKKVFYASSGNAEFCGANKNLCVGMEAHVTSIHPGMRVFDRIENGFCLHSLQGYRYLGYFSVDEIELITNEPSNSSENTVGKIMNNILKFAKNLTLSADEKLLRKFGLKNDCGEYTAEAKEFANLKLCQDKEADMIEVAKGLEKEEKASK